MIGYIWAFINRNIVKPLDVLIGEVNTALATALNTVKDTVDAINIRTNTINTNVNTMAAKNIILYGSAVKNVLRGTATGNGLNTVTISSVNPGKCMVLLNGMNSEVVQAYGETTTYTTGCYVASLAATSLGIYLGGYGSGGRTASWQIVEFY